MRTLGNIINVTPVISTGIYASGDQVGGIQTISGASNDGIGILEGITIVDLSDQSAALNILFFDELPTVASSDNAALNIADAEMSGKCIGMLTIDATDYVDTSANSVATLRNLNQMFHSRGVISTVYAVVETTGTPTYGGTSDLIFKYHVRF
jgi:hypothetical protein